MPLVRYEVRCEHSLANPELYRTAGQDDSEGLLEGVAMAGLVGLVRQLGDLAEFAAEIFHDLHDDIIRLVSRSRDLKSRVSRLEVDMPVLEKALIAECSEFQFAYSARTKWRAPLPMDQNLCAQGELPRFVRNFYEDCRGPPRLFLLDKFDEAGRGACVKRYTDPAFFRISWAASLVSRAEQERREREAEALKKISAVDNDAGPKILPRERLSSALFENLEGFTGDFTPELRSRRLDHVFELLPTDGVLTPEELRSPEEPRSPAAPRTLPQVAQGPVLAPLKICSGRDCDTSKRRALLSSSMEDVLSEDDEESSGDDDEAEFYVDALTTMGSDDPDSEPGSRTRWEAESNPSRFGFVLESTDEEETLNNLVLKALVEAHRKTPPRMDVEAERDDEEFARRLGLGDVGTGFDTVRGWEDSGEQTDEASGGSSIEITSVASAGEADTQRCRAIVALSVGQGQEEFTDQSSDMRPDKPPDDLPDTPSDKFPYSLPEKPPDNLSDRLPERLLITLPDRLPSTEADSMLPSSSPLRSPLRILPSRDEVLDAFPDKLPYQSPVAQLPPAPPSPLPSGFSDKGSDTVSGQSPIKLKASDGKGPRVPPGRSGKSSGKLSDKLSEKSPAKPRDGKLPTKRSPRGRSDKLPCKSPTKPLAEKPSYQSHDSVSLLDSFRPSLRVKPMIASIEARAQATAATAAKPAEKLLNTTESLEEKPLESARSPATTPRSRRLWTTANATQIHTSILQVADDSNGVNRMFGSEGNNSPEVDGYTSSATSSPKGMPNFGALLLLSGSPPRVAEGLMRPPPLSFGGRYPRPPPVTPFLADSPSVSRSPSLNGKPSAAGTIDAADKLQSVPATSPRRGSGNGGMQKEPSGNQSSILPNLVPRPRTWVDRSESNVAATLRAIRQAATGASDDDAGSECWTDC